MLEFTVLVYSLRKRNALLSQPYGIQCLNGLPIQRQESTPLRLEEMECDKTSRSTFMCENCKLATNENNNEERILNDNTRNECEEIQLSN